GVRRTLNDHRTQKQTGGQKEFTRETDNNPTLLLLSRAELRPALPTADAHAGCNPVPQYHSLALTNDTHRRYSGRPTLPVSRDPQYGSALILLVSSHPHIRQASVCPLHSSSCVC